MKTETLNNIHIYYIDEMNGHLYVADRKIVLGKYRKMVDNNDGSVIIVENFGDIEKRYLGFKEKIIAAEKLAQIKGNTL